MAELIESVYPEAEGPSARRWEVSARSELLFRASGCISNPLLLCALVSQRARQLMTGENGHRSTAEIVDCALCELLDGVLKFEMHGEKTTANDECLSRTSLNVAFQVAVEMKTQ